MNRTYFLGANSSRGFYSCYDSFCRPDDGDFLYIIKSGPGSGKSTLMRRVASAAQHRDMDVEIVLCSGDPDSLDGVYLPQLHVGVVDGTSPHVIEPRIPAASDLYLDLSGCYDVRAAGVRKESLGRLFHAYREQYRRAYSLLSRHTPPEAPVSLPAEAKRRLTLAVSCQGILRLPFPENAEVLDRPEFRRRLAHSAPTVLYLHPLWPELAEAYETADGQVFISEIPMPDCADAVAALQEAKRLHDQLEAAYRPCIDFSVVEDATDRVIRRIFENAD